MDFTAPEQITANRTNEYKTIKTDEQIAMKTEEIQQMFGEYEHAVCDANGVECWSARELCKLLGYSLWQNFTKVIDKAKVACENIGHEIDDHFIDVNKMIIMVNEGDRAENR